MIDPKELEQELPPDPAVLLRSLRGIGYGVEDAAADIIDNALSAGARRVSVFIRAVGDDVHFDVVDDGEGLSADGVRMALTLGARERDPGMARRSNDLGRFGLGLKTASFSVARRMTLFSKSGGACSSGAWDLDDVSVRRRWVLSPVPDNERSQLTELLADRETGTVVRWAKTERLGVNGAAKAASVAMLQERLMRHLGMTYHRFIEGVDAEGQPLPPVQLTVNGRPVVAWNPLLPLTAKPHLIELGEVRLARNVRAEYAIMPPDTTLTAEDRRELNLVGRRTADMQGFYVYRGNRLVCFATWLGLPGSGHGRWNKEATTQLARVAIDLTNETDEEWSLDVRKSRVVPPERDRAVLAEIGGEARARSRARIFGRQSGGDSRSGTKRNDSALPTLWELTNGRPHINRDHPLVHGLSSHENAEVRASVRALIRHLENSPALGALIAEPTEHEQQQTVPSILDDADIAEAVALGRCLLMNRTPFTSVLEILRADPRFGSDPSTIERIRAHLEPKP